MITSAIRLYERIKKISAIYVCDSGRFDNEHFDSKHFSREIYPEGDGLRRIAGAVSGMMLCIDRAATRTPRRS